MKLTSHPRRGTAGHGWNCTGQGAVTGQSPRPASKPGPSLSQLPSLPLKPQQAPVPPPMPVLHPWHKLFLYYHQVATALSPRGPQKYQVNARSRVCFNFSSLRLDLTLQAAQGGPGGPLEAAQSRHSPPPHTHTSSQFLVSGKLCLPWVTDG